MEVFTSNDFAVAKKIFELGLRPQVGFAQHEGFVLAYLDFLLGVFGTSWRHYLAWAVALDTACATAILARNLLLPEPSSQFKSGTFLELFRSG